MTFTLKRTYKQSLQDFALGVHSISCAEQSNRSRPPLRRVPAQIAPAQWPVGNVLFPTRLRCSLSRRLLIRSLKFVPCLKAKSLGCFLGLSSAM
ncbi:hypothetical protein DSY0656 [Desulfitobacterium hafniense Y51]|uniref:Uncharacterized protein n=1 Tax=Desulfitobacterium hafniense (strain Y51) TaxID=138119 RepID=Q24ZU7_DESHY|nr:hypothetical protein DSY0656 [Desulfitobacterium hafniense Y51]